MLFRSINFRLQLAARKRKLMKDYKADGVPEPELKTMDEVSI